MKASVVLAASLLLAAAPGFAQAPPPAQPEPVLLDIIRSDAPAPRRIEAMRQLGQTGTAKSVPVLAPLLTDERFAHWARITLERIPDPSVPETFKAALPKVKGRLLAGLIQSIANRPGTATGKNAKDVDTPVIAPYLKDADVEVASAAANALGRLGTVDAAKAIEQAIPSAPEPVKAVLWDAALRAANTLDRNGQRKDAVRVFDRVRASDAPAYVRLGAARGAVMARRAGGTSLLASMLEDQDRGLFNVALELANVLPGSETTRAILGRLPKLPAPRRALVVQALGNRGDKSALPAIRAAAREGDPVVRVAAIRALAQLQDADSVQILADSSVSKDEAVAEAAGNALVTMPGTAVEEALIRQAGGADPARSLAAIDALSRRQTRAAMPVLLKVAGEGAPPVRVAAYKALSDLATTSELDALLALLGKARSAADIEAAQETLTALGTRTASAGSAARIASAVNGSEPAQKMALLRVLEGVGGPAALQALRNSLKDSNAEVRATAVRGLANWSTAEAAPDLLTLARSAEDPNLKLLALGGFIRLSTDDTLPAERRVAMGADARPLITRDEERRQWLSALGGIPSAASLPLIVPLIGTAGVNEEACSAAVSVARKLLAGQAAASPGLKPQLPAIGEALQKAAANTKDERLAGEAKTLGAKVRELQK